MKDILKYGAIAAGAYLLYQQLFGKPAAAATTTPATTTTTPATTTTTTTTPAPNPTTRQLLMAATNNAATKNFHEWNWFYNSVRGIQPKAPEEYGMGDGLRLISVDEYLAALSTGGLSGLGGNWRRA